MLNKSHRHRRAARLAAAKQPELIAYEIVDKHHRPDLRGEFAGVRVSKEGSRHVVRLTERQARFYIDQGALRPVQQAKSAE